MVPLDEMGFTMAGICEYVYLFHYFEVVLPWGYNYPGNWKRRNEKRQTTTNGIESR
jgi:hypothetical protein